MLIGQYKSKLTDKDRLAVPKKFRQELGEELVIARWYENSLVLVSLTNWQLLKKRLVGETGLITGAIRDIDRFILGSAFEVKVDKQGRFVLADELKAYAQITAEVVFVGLEDRVEVWASETWQQLEAKAKDKATQAIEKLAHD